MSREAFTAPWTEAWVGELRRSDAYRRAAADWRGTLVFELVGAAEDGEAPRSVFLDLHRGECRSGRMASAEDLERADFVIRAGVDEWRRVLAGEIEPIYGLMSGKLELRRGSLMGLLPFVAASRELVAAASRLGTRFPGDPPEAE